MAARPLEHRLKIRRVPYLERRPGVERGVVDHADDLAGGLVAQGEEVGEVILAELVIVGKQPPDAPLLLYGGFLDDRQRFGRQSLNLPAVLLPLLEGLPLLLCQLSRHIPRVPPC